jgi:hypothetical protein
MEVRRKVRRPEKSEKDKVGMRRGVRSEKKQIIQQSDH